MFFLRLATATPGNAYSYEYEYEDVVVFSDDGSGSAGSDAEASSKEDDQEPSAAKSSTKGKGKSKGKGKGKGKKKAKSKPGSTMPPPATVPADAKKSAAELDAAFAALAEAAGIGGESGSEVASEDGDADGAGATKKKTSSRRWQAAVLDEPFVALARVIQGRALGNVPYLTSELFLSPEHWDRAAAAVGMKVRTVKKHGERSVYMADVKTFEVMGAAAEAQLRVEIPSQIAALEAGPVPPKPYVPFPSKARKASEAKTAASQTEETTAPPGSPAAAAAVASQLRVQYGTRLDILFGKRSIGAG